MSDLRKQLSSRLPRIHANGLKCFSMGIVLLLNFNTIILEKGILHLERYSPSELVAVMEASSTLTALVGVASVLRLLSGIAVPIFAFLTAEGFVHTSSYKKYLSSVTLTALVSEPLYDYAMNGTWMAITQQNPVWSIAISLIMLGILHMIENRNGVEKWICQLLVVLCAVFWVILFRVEYGLEIIVLSAIFYCFREYTALKTVLGILVSIMDPLGPFAFCGLIYYSGQHKLKIPKYWFYALYPLHLLVFGLILRNLLL